MFLSHDGKSKLSELWLNFKQTELPAYSLQYYTICLSNKNANIFNMTTQQWVTLPETNIAPENGWLKYSFPLGWPIFRGELLVSGRVGVQFCLHVQISIPLVDGFPLLFNIPRDDLFDVGWKPDWVTVILLILGGGFKYFLFSPLFGEDSHFD